mmetsp:Transcript_12419/g.25568  ORF Transcript_12419/g.25568 Transcript_12419/m.25568 type:complete len:272 (+) Transcript_12419:116-931(+)
MCAHTRVYHENTRLKHAFALLLTPPTHNSFFRCLRRLCQAAPPPLLGCSAAFFGNEAADLGDVVCDLELALAPVVVHVPDFAEHWAFLPPHVVHAPDGPHAAYEAVGVPSVQAVLVVEEDASPQCLLWALGPLQDLLRPIHSHESVELAPEHQLLLPRIPQLIVGFRGLELGGGVEMRPFVRGMHAECLLGPSGTALEGIVGLVVVTVVIAQLPSDHQLLDEPSDAFVMFLGEGLSLQSAALSGDLSKVEPRRHVRLRVLAWVVTLAPVLP